MDDDDDLRHAPSTRPRDACAGPTVPTPDPPGSLYLSGRELFRLSLAAETAAETAALIFSWPALRLFCNARIEVRRLPGRLRSPPTSVVVNTPQSPRGSFFITQTHTYTRQRSRARTTTASRADHPDPDRPRAAPLKAPTDDTGDPCHDEWARGVGQATDAGRQAVRLIPQGVYCMYIKQGRSLLKRPRATSTRSNGPS